MKRELNLNHKVLNTLAVGSIATLCSLAGYAQTYSFEDSQLPGNWKVENAVASFTTEHSTNAKVALMINVAPGQIGTITCPFPTPTKQTNAKYNFHVEIFSPEISDTPVTVNFYDESGELHLSGNAIMNFKGWMPYYRSYTKDYGSNGMTKKVAKMTISIDNTASSSPLRLCFDNWQLNASLSSIMALPINMRDIDKLGNQTTQPLQLYSYSYNARRSETLANPTPEEVSAISTLKAKYPLTPDATDTDLAAARIFVQQLNITRNADGTVKSDRIVAKAADYTKDKQVLILKHLNALAASAEPADGQLFADFMDAVLDANIFYRFPQLKWNTYADVRQIPRLMLAIMPKLSNNQASEWIKAIRWISEQGWADAPFEYFANNYNSDILYLNGGSNYYINCAVNDPDKTLAVREMKAVKRMLELAVTPISGGYEIMKPDGCGFHHGVHYNNYMYSFNPWISTALILKDTPFSVDRNAYDNIKKAILTCFSMSTRSSPYSNPADPTDATNNLYAKSLAGRHPFAGGQVNQFSPSVFQQAVQLSYNFFGGNPDPELAAAYNYYTITDTYKVPEIDFSGFYQYNYSPVGIYRTHDWVVTMRCPTTVAWGAEIYSKKNRFGRYQSTGSMEVMYNGAKSNSGIPQEAAGYDWNVVPGTTTVHYTDWKSMLPSGNITSRFDQFSASTDYAGALVWNSGKAGIFSCEYVQSDAHNNSTVCYSDAIATNLKFHKTILAVDGILFNIGSDISTQGKYNDNWITATNLFQEVGNDLTDFNVNGAMMTREAEPKNLNCENADIWMVSPKGTGIIVPKGNDNVVVKYGTQEGPHGDGGTYNTKPETAIGAKAYINHGVKVSNEKYSYLMIPGTSADKLSTSANEIATRFDIISGDGSFHGIYYKPQAITALSFFNPMDNTGLDFVKSTSTQLLMMYQKQENGNMALALCLPNLKPNRLSSSLWDWKSAGTNSTITLEGEWLSDSDTPKNASFAIDKGKTTIDVAFSDGLPVYLNLKPTGAGVKHITLGEFNVKVSNQGDDIIVTLSVAADNDVTVEVYDLNGIKVGSGKITTGENTCRVINASTSTVNIVRVSSENGVKTIKVVR